LYTRCAEIILDEDVSNSMALIEFPLTNLAVQAIELKYLRWRSPRWNPKPVSNNEIGEKARAAY